MLVTVPLQSTFMYVTLNKNKSCGKGLMKYICKYLSFHYYITKPCYKNSFCFCHNLFGPLDN